MILLDKDLDWLQKDFLHGIPPASYGEWTGLPAQGSLLIRLPITKRSVTVAYRIFVPFTAAGQRGFLTPLPQIHPDSDYKDMFPTATMILHLKQQQADVKKKIVLPKSCLT